MPDSRMERRSCIRFAIPGSTISYKDKRLILPPQNYGEEFCPISDISRGGIRFLCHEAPRLHSVISMKIAVPGESVPLHMTGIVRWIGICAGKSYKHQVGVQFTPYGENKNQNYPGNLVKIIALEQKFSAGEGSEPPPESDDSTGQDFEVS